MKIITDRFTPDLPLAIVAGTFASDPLDGRDGPLLATGWRKIMDALGPLADTMLTLREVLLAAYSLGARHALERVDALRRSNCADVPDEETVCLGDEPRPPQLRRDIPDSELPPDVQADIRDCESREELSRPSQLDIARGLLGAPVYPKEVSRGI